MASLPTTIVAAPRARRRASLSALRRRDQAHRQRRSLRRIRMGPWATRETHSHRRSRTLSLQAPLCARPGACPRAGRMHVRARLPREARSRQVRRRDTHLPHREGDASRGNSDLAQHDERPGLARRRCLHAPLAGCSLTRCALDPHVQADETSFRTQTRSGDPSSGPSSPSSTRSTSSARRAAAKHGKKVLGGTTGSLTVDGYTGYNIVTEVEVARSNRLLVPRATLSLRRAPHAPPRRDKGSTSSSSSSWSSGRQCSGNIVGTAEHLALRQRRSAPTLARLRARGSTR